MTVQTCNLLHAPDWQSMQLDCQMYRQILQVCRSISEAWKSYRADVTWNILLSREGDSVKTDVRRLLFLTASRGKISRYFNISLQRS